MKSPISSAVWKAVHSLLGRMDLFPRMTAVVFLPTLFVIHHLSGKAGPKAIRIISKIAAIFLSVWCLIVLIAVILFKTVGF